MSDLQLRQPRPGLTKEDFDRLLSWLDPDRERAAGKYESIRTRLIKVLNSRGCAVSEDLVDETFDRVARKVQVIAETYEGDPALYFYGTAKKVYQEHLRKSAAAAPQMPPPTPSADEREDGERAFDCLDRCMQLLPPKNREIVLVYYQEEKRKKIEGRHRLAEALGISLNALRIRAHRIRAGLEQCVMECLNQRQEV